MRSLMDFAHRDFPFFKFLAIVRVHPTITAQCFPVPCFVFFFHCRKVQIKTVSSNKRTLTKKLTSITAQVHINKQGRRNVVSFGGGGQSQKRALICQKGHLGANIYFHHQIRFCLKKLCIR